VLKESVKLSKASVFLSLQALHKLANSLFHALCIWCVKTLLVLGTWIRIRSSLGGLMSPLLTDMGRLA
jgi:hypothetical protein